MLKQKVQCYRNNNAFTQHTAECCIKTATKWDYGTSQSLHLNQLSVADNDAKHTSCIQHIKKDKHFIWSQNHSSYYSPHYIRKHYASYLQKFLIDFFSCKVCKQSRQSSAPSVAWTWWPSKTLQKVSCDRYLSWVHFIFFSVVGKVLSPSQFVQRWNPFEYNFLLLSVICPHNAESSFHWQWTWICGVVLLAHRRHPQLFYFLPLVSKR